MTVTTHGDAVVAAPEGEVDFTNAPRLQAELLAALEPEPKLLVIDMSSLQLLDSTGLGALVATARRAGHLGTMFCLVAPKAIVARALQVTALDRVWPTYPTVAEALHAHEQP